MNSKIIPLFFIVAFLTSTSLGLHHLVVAARRSLDIILERQLNCSSLCSSAQTMTSSCNTTACLCTTAIAESIQACINCGVANDPSISVVSDAQSIIDDFENLCSTVAGIPSVTINTNPVTVSITSSIPISQIIIGPSSTTTTPTPITQAVSSEGSTSTTSIGSLPLQSSSSSSPNKINLHWTGTLLGLAVGNLLVF